MGGSELTLEGAKGCPDAERRAGRALGTGHRAGEGARPGPVLAECVSGLLGRGAVSSPRPSVLAEKCDSVLRPWPPPDRNNLKEAALAAGANGGFGVSPGNTGLGLVFPELTCPG